MTYPKQLKLFKAWAKAMEQGSTVDKPSYGKTRTGQKGRAKPLRRSNRFRRKRKQQE